MKHYLVLGVMMCVLGCQSSQYGNLDEYDVSLQQFQNRVQRESKTPSSPAPTQNNVFTLPWCVDQALKNSRNLQLAKLGIGIAEDRMDAAMSFFLPKLNVGVGYQFVYRKPSRSTDESLGDEIYGHLLTGRVNLIVPIYDFGPTSANYNKARLFALTQRAQESLARQQVIFEATKAYFDLLSAEHLRKAAEENLLRARSHLKQTEDFLSEGIVEKKDYLQGKVRWAQAEQWLSHVVQGKQLAESNLRKILGIESQDPLKIADFMDNPSLPAILPLERYKEMALKHRPDLHSVFQQIQIARTDLESAQSSRYPRIYGIGSYGYDGAQFDRKSTETKDSLNLDNHLLMGGVMIEMNILNGGLTKAKISEANKAIRQAELAYKENTAGVKLQVEKAYLALCEAEKNLMVTRSTIEQAEENWRILDNQYREHIISSTELLDGQTLLTQAKVEHIRSLHALHVAKAYLELSVGTPLYPAK
jgi:outer membrane protein TolC